MNVENILIGLADFFYFFSGKVLKFVQAMYFFCALTFDCFTFSSLPLLKGKETPVSIREKVTKNMISF